MKSKRSIVFWISVVKSVLFLLLTLALLIVIGPVFVEMLADFGAELPKATQAVLKLSDFCKSYFLLLQIPFLGFGALLVWTMIELDKRKQNILMILLSMVPTLFALLILIALLLPIFSLSISGK